MAISLYDVIGVEPTATAAELRRAYLRRARTLHPDQSGDTEGMQELNAAWEVLGDAAARAAYDRERAPAPAPVEQAAAPPEPWDDEDARVAADIHRRMAEPFDPVAAFLRALPVLVVLFLLFVVFLFTAYAGGGSDDGEVNEMPTVTVLSAPEG